MFLHLQMYRCSVITQWRAQELDVVLAPMLGPAPDLNGPGKATGEAPEPLLLPSPPLLFAVFCPVPREAAGKRDEGTSWGGHVQGEGPHPSWPSQPILGDRAPRPSTIEHLQLQFIIWGVRYRWESDKLMVSDPVSQGKAVCLALLPASDLTSWAL